MNKFFLNLLALSMSLLWGSALAAPIYQSPTGGWTYTYSGTATASGSGGSDAFDALDGTWSHDNGSDQWDGSAIGAGRPPEFDSNRLKIDQYFSSF
jgi:hypothetical protein